ncbi:MAG: formylglycine-generating enzyme family protein [Deltaproteobacteria bacterium]|nr:formylglycine-generating enzyme family protein [Deltaproteobacteria bacterium]
MHKVLLVLALLVIGCGKSKAPPAEVPTATAAGLPQAATASDDGQAAVAAAVHEQKAAAAKLAASSQITPGFVPIPAGTFTMGRPDNLAQGFNEATQHQVVLTRPFEMQATEVTLAQYRDLMSTSSDQRLSCDECPVAHVSWFQAASYCNELSRRKRVPQCYVVAGLTVTWPDPACTGFRLPTEAEWEFAARGGVAAARPDDLAASGWYDENAGLRAHPVKQKRANAYGLYDMIGNVAEWVWDWHADYPRNTAVDPRGPTSGDNRIFRGGSFHYGAADADVWSRSAFGPPNQVPFIGFRCVRQLPAAGAK